MAFLTSKKHQTLMLKARSRASCSFVSPRSILRLFHPLLVLLPIFLLAHPFALGQSASEYQLKAAFLFNFTQFVDWPPKAFNSPESPIVIGVIGSDPFKGALDNIVHGETVQKRTLIIARYRRIEDIRECHLLFVSQSEKAKLPQILAALQGRPILTASDIEGFAENGGMVGFFNQAGKIRFRIHLGRTRAEDLKISSKLLRLADVIGTEGAE